MKRKIQIQVDKSGTDNNLGLIRKFGKKVQESKILPKVRSLRFISREPSDYVKKKSALRKIAYKEKIQEMIKMGKISENPKGKVKINLNK